MEILETKILVFYYRFESRCFLMAFKAVKIVYQI